MDSILKATLEKTTLNKDNSANGDYVSANGLFHYDQKIKNKTLYNHGIDMNEYLSNKNGWFSLDRTCYVNTWGCDSDMCRIGKAVAECDAKSTIDEVAASIHKGWSDCFIFWSCFKPWLWFDKDHKRFKKPFKRLTDKQNRALKDFNELDNYQKKILYQMATYVKLNCL